MLWQNTLGCDQNQYWIIINILHIISNEIQYPTCRDMAYTEIIKIAPKSRTVANCTCYCVMGILSNVKYWIVTLEYHSLLHQCTGEINETKCKEYFHFVIHEWSQIVWWKKIKVFA